MRRLWKRVKQGLLWVAVKMAQAIIFVVDTVQAVAEVIKKTATATVEVTVEVVQRIRENDVIKTIGKGVDLLKKIKDAKEFPRTARRIVSGFWAYVTGKACFSWAASSGLCTLCSLGYAALLVGSFTFSLYLLGLLSTAFRS